MRPLNYVHTSYLSLAIPPGWRCAQESTAFVCGRNPAAGTAETRLAVIIFTAKEAGDSDGFTAYRTHLDIPRVVHDDGSEITRSVVEEVSERRIAGRRWIIGRHLNSELLDYRTWYFAAIADDIAVLATFSAHRDFAEAYLKDVETGLENLTLTKPVKNQ